VATLLIDADEIEDGERLCELIRVTAAALPPPKAKKPRKSRAGNRFSTASRQSTGRKS